MPTWIAFTLTAALFQTWRTALQQRLRGRFSVGTAGFVRYVYAIPVGVLLLGAYLQAFGGVLPVGNVHPNQLGYDAIARQVAAAVVPVPEPSTWAVVLGGLGMLGLRARKRRAASAQ